MSSLVKLKIMSFLVRDNYYQALFKKIPGVLLPLVFFCCSEPKNTQIKDSDTISVYGTVDSATTFTDYQHFQIDQHGQRSDPPEYTYSDGNFSFELDLTSLITVEKLGIVERISNMGRDNAPAEFLPGDFSKKPLGFGRLEIWGELDTTNQTLYYLHALIPVARNSVLSGRKSIPLGQIIPHSVAYAEVTVIDRESQPIAEVSVGVINLIDSRPVRLWDEKPYAPVFNLTDENGLAQALAISSEGTEPQFQIIAFKDGYCPFISFPAIFDTLSPTTSTITLDTCSESSILPGDLVADFAPDVNQKSVEDTAFGTSSVAQINGTQVTLRLNPKNLDLRPLTVNIYEGYVASGTVLTQKVLNTFSSELTLDIPAAFANNSPNGSFTIEIVPRRSEADYHLGELNPILLYGQKETTKPQLFATQFSVYSSADVTDFISGIDDISFTITIEGCREGDEITILDELEILTENTPFFNCEEGLISIPGQSIAYTNAVTGAKVLKFFKRDIFGNLSEDDSVNKENHRTIFVDFSPPDLDQDPLIVSKVLNNLGEFGFAPMGDALGTEANPYIFKNTIYMTPATASSFVLRFSQPSKCQLISHDLSTDMRDNQIAWFSNGHAGETSLDRSSGATCGQDLALAADDFSFPDSITESASITLQVLDAAGNPSRASVYTIPPCPQSDPIVEFCWRPNP